MPFEDVPFEELSVEELTTGETKAVELESRLERALVMANSETSVVHPIVR